MKKQFTFSIICFLSLIFIGESHSQDNLSIGDWQSFLPYNTGKWVTQSDDHIIYATDFSLLTIDVNDNSAEFISKVEGLSDAGIELIRYDPFNDQLIVVYTNSNIDIITASDIINDSSIKDNTNIIGSRKVFDIHIADANRTFFSTAFGIIEYRSVKKEFGTTIFTSVPVVAIQKYGDFLYAATEDGLYAINEKENPNIGNFGKWTLLGNEAGLPPAYEAIDVESFRQKLYVTDGLSIYVKAEENEVFTEIYQEENNAFDITYLSSGQSFLMAGLRANGASRMVLIDGENNISELSGGCIDRIRYSIEDNQGRIWMADNFRDFRYMESPSGPCKRLSFNSPLTEKASDIEIGKNIVAVASGGVTDSYGDLFSRDGVFILEDGKWLNLNENSFSPFKDNDLINFFQLALSNDQDQLFMGTFWKGILEYDLNSGNTELYNENNSALQPATGDGKVRISDLITDEKNNLWICNYNSPRPLVLKTDEGDWYSYAVSGDNRIGDLAIDDRGNKWMVSLGNTNGVFVFNEGEDFSSGTDDSRRLINLNNSVIPTSIVYTVVSDLNGDVWVGTAAGAIVFESGQDVFNNDYPGLRKTVEVDGIGAFLLESEEVISIGVDGANRKWFGTRNGIFVQSAEGDVQVERITVDNSPLFDNEIIDLAYDGVSGDMYIATNKGVQKVRTATTIGSRTHGNNVYAYPNPVAPDHIGPIAIKGLANNAEVKITDLSGKLIFETQALGGQAIWDGNDLSGGRVNSGVYLVFSTASSTFGEQDSYVTKILFID